MIRIPHELQPSSLLWIDDLRQRAKALWDECRHFRQVTSNRPLELIAHEANDLYSQGNREGSATVLVAIADLYREDKMLGPALEWSEQAEQRFCCYHNTRHEHNHAVAGYSVGLVHHLLHSDRNALDWYDKALTGFAGAKGMWVRLGRREWIDKCDLAMRWIRRLRDRLFYARSHSQPSHRGRVLVPVLSRISAGDPMLAGEEFEKWEEVDEARANGAHFALAVKGDSMLGVGIHDGDLVLIEQKDEWPTDGQVVAVRIEQMESEAILKRFYKEGDHIRLEPANASYPLIIIRPTWLPEPAIHAGYAKSHPKRLLQIYSEDDVRIVGWFRGKV